jgi:hypothetical protein
MRANSQKLGFTRVRCSVANIISTYNKLRRPSSGVEVYLHPLFNLGARWGWVVNATLRPFYPQKRPGAHCTGGWVGPRASLIVLLIYNNNNNNNNNNNVVRTKSGFRARNLTSDLRIRALWLYKRLQRRISLRSTQLDRILC